MELRLPAECKEENRTFCVDAFRRVHELLRQILPSLDEKQGYVIEFGSMGEVPHLEGDDDVAWVKLIGSSGLLLHWYLDFRPDTSQSDNASACVRLETAEGFVMSVHYDGLDDDYDACRNAEWTLFLSEDIEEPSYFTPFLQGIERMLEVPQLYCDQTVSEAHALMCIRKMAGYFLEHHVLVADAQDARV